MNFNDQKWDTVIEKGHNPFSLKPGQIHEYRDLIRIFVKRDIVTT